MTYGVERMTLGGNTLHDKLRAQLGERMQRSVDLGLEANARKAAENARMEAAARAASRANARESARPANASRPNTRTVGSATAPRANARTATAPRANARPAGASANGRTAPRANTRPMGAPAVNARPMGAPAANTRPAYDEPHRLTVPNAPRYASERELYEKRNPYRARINYMRRPVTGKSDLEISIATFPQAYRAGMRAQRVMGDRIIYDRSAARARVRRGYRPGEQKSGGTALDNSRGTMSGAYTRGEQMRRVTDFAHARPTPKNAKGIEVPTKFERFLTKVKAVFVGKGRHVAEVKIKRAPFPIGTLALIIVCTLVVMVMISSFAQLSQYRADISDLEYRASKLAEEESRLAGLVENREDIRVIEQIATKEIGMVSAELAAGRFVSLADVDRVEVVEDGTPEERGGIFATILSSISENLGAISDYIN